MTLFEFASAAAVRAGRTIELVLRVETSQAWGPALRPRNGALSSSRAQLMRPLHLRSMAIYTTLRMPESQ